MSRFHVLAEAILYIEERLSAPPAQEEIAAHCHYSLSGLQKVFRYALHMSVKEYTDRRRLTEAARALLQTDETVLDIALRFSYGSPEVFGRAFVRLWGVTPSEFRRTWRFSGIFPRIERIKIEGDGDMSRQNDIHELYDILKNMADTYVLSFDINGLTPINDISRAAGDLAIREALKRIESHAGENMPLFRVGGDEFALVTRLSDIQEVTALARTILSHNGEPILYENQEIPLSLRAAALRLDGDALDYDELGDTLKRSSQKTLQGDHVLYIQAE